MNFHFGFWDWMLIAAVAIQTLLVTYLRHPKWRALAMTLPIPFTVACLAVGKPINATHVMGIAVFYVFVPGVRLLHERWRWPIVPAIVLCAVAYATISMLLVPLLLPPLAVSFWLACAGSSALSFVVLLLMPFRHEPVRRTALPVWIKTPIILAVIVTIVLLKHRLQGFMTFFPMVSSVGAYEMRHSLWTANRQMPIAYLPFIPTVMLVYLLEPRMGLGWAFIPGWILYLLIMIPVLQRQWRQHDALSMPPD